MTKITRVIYCKTLLFPVYTRIYTYLVKNGPIKTEEFDVHGFVLLSYRAYVEHLAGGLKVRIITADHLPRTREVSFGKVIEVQILESKKKIHEELYNVKFFLSKVLCVKTIRINLPQVEWTLISEIHFEIQKAAATTKLKLD